MGSPEARSAYSTASAVGDAAGVLPLAALEMEETTALAGGLSISHTNKAGAAAPEREPSSTAAPSCGDMEDIVAVTEEPGTSIVTQVKHWNLAPGSD